jgi:putative sigma-54 modulation protein
MEYKFYFNHIPHSDFIINAVQTKIGRSIQHILGGEVVKVTVGKKGYEFSIGITINGRSGVYYKASAKAENLYAAIDLLQDKLEKQINKQRKKITNHKRPELSKEGRINLLDEGLSTDFRFFKKKNQRDSAA